MSIMRVFEWNPAWKIVLLLIFFHVKMSAQLELSLENTRSSNQGDWNIFAHGIVMKDNKIPYLPHRVKGPYVSLGFEYMELDYRKGKTRMKYNFDLMGDLLYYIFQWIRTEEAKDVDDRYSNTSFFSGGLLEAVVGQNVLSRKKYNIGVAFAFYDVMYQHKLIDSSGGPERPQTSMVNGYGLYAGWGLYTDVLISKQMTLHLDFIRGYGFYHARKEQLQNAGEPSNPFGSWKLSGMLLHQSGFFVNFRYHQMIARTPVPTEAARIQFGLGYRFGMYKYNGQTHLKDPRRDPNKVTF